MNIESRGADESLSFLCTQMQRSIVHTISENELFKIKLGKVHLRSSEITALSRSGNWVIE